MLSCASFLSYRKGESMFSLSSKDWRFLSIQDGYAVFLNKHDGSKLEVTRVKYFNSKLDGAAAFDNGEFEITVRTRRSKPDVQLAQILSC